MSLREHIVELVILGYCKRHHKVYIDKITVNHLRDTFEVNIYREVMKHIIIISTVEYNIMEKICRYKNKNDIMFNLKSISTAVRDVCHGIIDEKVEVTVPPFKLGK